MALLKLVRRNCGGKLQASIKYQNLHSFKGGVIILCQSNLETRIMSQLHGSPLFTIPLGLRHIIMITCQLLQLCGSAVLMPLSLILMNCLIREQFQSN